MRAPSNGYAREDIALLAARHTLYQEAKARHPRRWSRSTLNWSPISFVTPNPEREVVVNAALDPSIEERESAAPRVAVMVCAKTEGAKVA